MATRGNRLSGDRWNNMLNNVLSRAYEIMDNLRDDFLADGHPPFTYPLSDRQVYDRLVAMRQIQDPAYWNNPEAQAELQRLSQQFGPPPPPFAGVLPPFAQGTKPLNLTGNP